MAGVTGLTRGLSFGLSDAATVGLDRLIEGDKGAEEMRRAIVKLDGLQTGWTEKAELALSKGREDLAKAALTERQKALT